MSKVDLKREGEKRLKNKVGRRHRRDTKLQELEKQLEFAESRCGTLKQQLDYIKQLYRCGNLKKRPSREEGHGDGSEVKQFNFTNASKRNDFKSYENGDCPGFVKQTSSHTITTSTNSSNKHFSTTTNLEREEEPRRKGRYKQKANLKLLKVKKKTGKRFKKRRQEDATSSKVSNASSQTPSQVWQDPVVEIYKNTALNAESESVCEIVCGKNRIIRTSGKSEGMKKRNLAGKSSGSLEFEDAKDKSLDEFKTKSCNAVTTKKGGALKEEGNQAELFNISMSNQSKGHDPTENINKESAIKIENIFYEPLKSYCQPTISSKKKKVEREICSNLTSINVRNIPFIAAKSTAPSHNIGVNIQQVLSIMKKRNPVSENPTEWGGQENQLLTLLSSKKLGTKTSELGPDSEPGPALAMSLEPKKRSESLSHWKSNSDLNRDKPDNTNGKIHDNQAHDWGLKVHKLKKVLVFLHEDFTLLSQKYKRLQKKLTKRNITKTDAKDELADIERELEKKEEEITVVIGLYREVLNLKEDFKKLQEKYNLVACGRTLAFEGLRQSKSTHTQMTTLLRKIQNFQDQLKS